MILSENGELVCPRGKPGEAPLVIDLSEILAAEKRQDEVASVTRFKAPELLSLFNRAWRGLFDLVADLGAEQTKAEKHLNDRKAVLLLEVIPTKLASLKLVNNEAHRDAVIQLDPQHQRLHDTLDQIEAAGEWLKGKMKFFENAYNSVKKIMGEDSYNMAGKGSNPNLSGGTGPTTPAPGAQKSPPKAGWGKPRY